MQLPDWLVKSFIGLAGTAGVALTGAVISGASTNAAQDVHITDLQADQRDTTETLKHLDETVNRLDKDVATLHERLRDGQR